MRILFLSQKGDGLGIAARLSQEGHTVLVFIKHKGPGVPGTGLVHMVESWRPHVYNSDFIICDAPGFHMNYQLLRGNGRPVLGCIQHLPYSAIRETFKKAGIPLLQPTEGHGWGGSNVDGIGRRFQMFDEGLVLGEFHHREDWEHQKRFLPEDGLHVESIPLTTGVEFTICGWWNGRFWVDPFWVALNNNSYHDSDGLVDSMGTSVIALHKTKGKLLSMIQPLEPFMLSTLYRGLVTVTARLEGDVLIATSLHLGFHFDGIEAFFEGLSESTGDFLFDVASGVAKLCNVSQDFLMSTRLTRPPWPFADPNITDKGLLIHGVDARNVPHIFFSDTTFDGESFHFGAHNGVVLKATARGRTFREANNRIQKTLSRVTVLHGYYRPDIGHDAERKWGLLKDFA